MIALGFGIVWIGYLETLYGYCLLRGWDITWTQLANPVHIYKWPSPGEPSKIPGDQIIPAGGAKGAGSHTEGTVDANKTAPSGGHVIDT